MLNLGELVAGARRAGKPVFVHLDFIEGIAADKSGIRYIAEKIRPSGVISTRHHLIAAARERGLKAVQRLFLIDSTAVDKGLKAIRSTAPDAVEVMPGLMPKVIAEIVEKTSIPVIAGGLIREEEEVRSALRAGAVAVSVGDPRLWEVKTG